VPTHAEYQKRINSLLFAVALVMGFNIHLLSRMGKMKADHSKTIDLIMETCSIVDVKNEQD
jgi:hypothetical protein